MEKSIHTNAILRLQKHRWRKRQIRTATRNSRYRSGDYRVQEKKVLRYSLMQVTGTKNVTVKKLEEPAYGKDPARVFSVSVNLCGHPKESEVVFENQKYRWDDYGHNSIVKNRIPVE